MVCGVVSAHSSARTVNSVPGSRPIRLPSSLNASGASRVRVAFQIEVALQCTSETFESRLRHRRPASAQAQRHRQRNQ